MSRSPIKIFNEIKDKAFNIFTKDIWASTSLNDTDLRGRIYSYLRILFIIIRGITDNRIFSRAAALSYYALISLGPLIAIIIMISGFVLKKGESDLAINSLNKLILFIAPSVSELNKANEREEQMNELQNGSVESTETQNLINPELTDLLNNIISSAQSGTVGVVGLLMLIFVGIQLITSIETVFNEIWGVRRGRSWFQRIVFYWTFISLGSVVGFASVTIISASTLAQIFNKLPFGPELSAIFFLLGPVISFLLVILLLMAFYAFIPNTQVKLKPVIIGSTIVALLLFLNNYLSFFYVQRVIESKSLYGSLGIIPVLMLGLYIFWVFILFGGQITYSIQNVNFLSNKLVWNQISLKNRETLNLAVFISICRRFNDDQPLYTFNDLIELLSIPGHILNECLSRLCDLGWINKANAEDSKDINSIKFLPARSLDKITLAEFKKSLDEFNHTESMGILQKIDPLIDHYLTSSDEFLQKKLGNVTLYQLLSEHQQKL